MKILKTTGLFVVICVLLSGCGMPSEDASMKEPTEEPIALGFPGNPVTSNTQWMPVIEEFDGYQMALVPVGCFLMGSDSGRENESPAHEQCIEKPYYIDIYEVSTRQYGKDVSPKYLDLPIEWVDWYEAAAHCESRGGHLPTEVEWEYAARGPDNLIYTWRSERFISGYLVSHLSAGEVNWGPLPVGSKPEGASWVGAHDMIGNVWEWTGSIFADYPYPKDANIEDSASLDESESVVIRGNSFVGEEDSQFRAAFRRTKKPTASSEGVGFRCVFTK